METARPFPPLVIAVVDDNPADVYFIARVLQAHGLPYTLQVLESRQRALHFFDRLAAQNDVRCPDLLLLDYTLPGLDTRELLQWIKALSVCRRLRIIVMTGSEDPAVRKAARALGADAFFQKPVSFQGFMALGEMLKVVMFGHTQTSQSLLVHDPLTGCGHEKNPEARSERTTVWQKREPQKILQVG